MFFFCIRLVCCESEQLGLSWLLLFLVSSSLHLHIENHKVFLTGIEKSFNPLTLRSEAWNQAGLLIAVSRCAWTRYVCFMLEKLTAIDFSWNLVHPTQLIRQRTRRQTRCGTISENLAFMSLDLWTPLITWKWDCRYWVIPKQMLPCNQGFGFYQFCSISVL